MGAGLLAGCGNDDEQRRDSQSGPQQSAEQYQNTVAEPALEERQGTGTGGHE